MVKKLKGPDEIQCDGVETVTKFCYLGDRLNATDGFETAVTARTRIGWKKFWECGQILVKDEKEGLQKLFKISYVAWK